MCTFFLIQNCTKSDFINYAHFFRSTHCYWTTNSISGQESTSGSPGPGNQPEIILGQIPALGNDLLLLLLDVQ